MHHYYLVGDNSMRSLADPEWMHSLFPRFVDSYLSCHFFISLRISRFDIALVYKCSKQHTGIDGQLPWQQLVYKKQNICIIKKMKARFELSTYRLHNEICTQQFNVDV